MGRLRHVSVVFFAAMILSSVPAGGVKQADPNDAKPTSMPAGISSVKADSSSGKKADDDFFSMSLEELMEIEVISSARRAQPLSRATSAMYVITAEDIRNAGVTKLQDIFRFVPGMEIAEMSNGVYRTGIRGSIARRENLRTLYLVDGRPLYEPVLNRADFRISPLFLDNIERIEIIRGPGGVAWGESSMNGVINIITKKAKDTQGSTIYGAAGTRELQEGFIRYGGTSGRLDYRATAGAYHGNGSGANGGDDVKDWDQGFKSDGRIDYTVDENTFITASGGQISGTSRGVDSNRQTIQYFTFQWEKHLSDNQTLSLQWNESFYNNEMMGGSHPYKWNSRVDMLELRYNIFNDVHNIIWGAGYNRDHYNIYWRSSSTTTDYLQQRYNPSRFSNDIQSMFLEDEITLAGNLWLTLGARVHYNEVTHGDWAGRAALVWEFAPKHFLRGSVARTFRRPRMIETNVWDQRESKTTGLVRLVEVGNRNLENEEMLAYEIGYRGKFAKNLELNVEGFLYKHHNLIAGAMSATAEDKAEYEAMGFAQTSALSSYYNVQNLTTYGVETSVDYKPFDWWLMRASHSYEHQTDENRINKTSVGKLWGMAVPQHKVSMTNRFYLDGTTTLNTKVFWSDCLYDNNYNQMNPYWRMDVRLSKRIWKDQAEIAVGFNNIQQQFHAETSNQERVQARLFYVEFYYNF